jgi:NAD(P)-dependent dehydrogenase (short-subunit alcohol dehydrogenase family)
MTTELSDKVLLITGATGIAAATARLAADRGASVFIASLDERDCAQLADEVRAEGCRCQFHACDLTIPGAAQAAVRACVSDFGRVDGLFNVAGISGRRFGDGPVHECTTEGWERTLEANATSTFLMCRAGIRQMLNQSLSPSGLRGAILNMASVLAFSPEPEHFATHAYAASKGAIISLSKAMAAYYAPHKIRVNVIAPGLARTPMSVRAQGDQQLLEFVAGKQPLAGSMIEADDVARAALFLLGDDARYITGEVVTVDAGWCG